MNPRSEILIKRIIAQQQGRRIENNISEKNRVDLAAGIREDLLKKIDKQSTKKSKKTTA